MRDTIPFIYWKSVLLKGKNIFLLVFVSSIHAALVVLGCSIVISTASKMNSIKILITCSYEILSFKHKTPRINTSIKLESSTEIYDWELYFLRLFHDIYKIGIILNLYFREKSQMLDTYCMDIQCYFIDTDSIFIRREVGSGWVVF